MDDRGKKNTCAHAEEDQVCSGHVFLGQALLSIYNHICSWGVYNVDITEQLCRQLAGEEAIIVLK